MIIQSYDLTLLRIHYVKDPNYHYNIVILVVNIIIIVITIITIITLIILLLLIITGPMSKT